MSNFQQYFINSQQKPHDFYHKQNPAAKALSRQDATSLLSLKAQSQKAESKSSKFMDRRNKSRGKQVAQETSELQSHSLQPSSNFPHTLAKSGSHQVLGTGVNSRVGGNPQTHQLNSQQAIRQIYTSQNVRPRNHILQTQLLNQNYQVTNSLSPKSQGSSNGSEANNQLSLGPSQLGAQYSQLKKVIENQIHTGYEQNQNSRSDPFIRYRNKKAEVNTKSLLLQNMLASQYSQGSMPTFNNYQSTHQSSIHRQQNSQFKDQGVLIRQNTAQSSISSGMPTIRVDSNEIKQPKPDLTTAKIGSRVTQSHLVPSYSTPSIPNVRSGVPMHGELRRQQRDLNLQNMQEQYKQLKLQEEEEAKRLKLQEKQNRLIAKAASENQKALQTAEAKGAQEFASPFIDQTPFFYVGSRQSVSSANSLIPGGNSRIRTFTQNNNFVQNLIIQPEDVASQTQDPRNEEQLNTIMQKVETLIAQKQDEHINKLQSTLKPNQAYSKGGMTDNQNSQVAAEQEKRKLSQKTFNSQLGPMIKEKVNTVNQLAGGGHQDIKTQDEGYNSDSELLDSADKTSQAKSTLKKQQTSGQLVESDQSLSIESKSKMPYSSSITPPFPKEQSLTKQAKIQKKVTINPKQEIMVSKLETLKIHKQQSSPHTGKHSSSPEMKLRKSLNLNLICMDKPDDSISGYSPTMPTEQGKGYQRTLQLKSSSNLKISEELADEIKRNKNIKEHKKRMSIMAKDIEISFIEEVNRARQSKKRDLKHSQAIILEGTIPRKLIVQNVIQRQFTEGLKKQPSRRATFNQAMRRKTLRMTTKEYGDDSRKYPSYLTDAYVDGFLDDQNLDEQVSITKTLRGQQRISFLKTEYCLQLQLLNPFSKHLEQDIKFEKQQLITNRPVKLQKGQLILPRTKKEILKHSHTSRSAKKKLMKFGSNILSNDNQNQYNDSFSENRSDLNSNGDFTLKVSNLSNFGYLDDVQSVDLKSPLNPPSNHTLQKEKTKDFENGGRNQTTHLLANQASSNSSYQQLLSMPLREDPSLVKQFQGPRNKQHFKFANQARLSLQQVQSQILPTTSSAVKYKEIKHMQIIKAEQLARYEEIIMQEYFKKRDVQKSLLRSLTGQVNNQRTLKQGAMTEESQLADSILYIFWQKKINKVYYVFSKGEVLDKIDFGFEEEKVEDQIAFFRIELKYQVKEDDPEDKKHQDMEINKMLHDLDNLVSSCTDEPAASQRTSSYKDKKDNGINSQRQRIINDESEHRIMNLDIQVLTHYFRDNFFYFYAQKGTVDLGYQHREIRRGLHSKVQELLGKDFFENRYERIISHLRFSVRLSGNQRIEKKERKVLDKYDLRGCNSTHKRWEIHSLVRDYLFRRHSRVPAADIVKMLFQSHQDNIFNLLYDYDEDYELTLTLDTILIIAQLHRQKKIIPAYQNLSQMIRKQTINVFKQKNKLIDFKSQEKSNHLFVRRDTLHQRKAFEMIIDETRKTLQEINSKNSAAESNFTSAAFNFKKKLSLKEGSMNAQGHRNSEVVAISLSPPLVPPPELRGTPKSKSSSPTIVTPFDQNDFLPLVRKNALRRNIEVKITRKMFKQQNMKQDSQILQTRMYKRYESTVAHPNYQFFSPNLQSKLPPQPNSGMLKQNKLHGLGGGERLRGQVQINIMQISEKINGYENSDSEDEDDVESLDSQNISDGSDEKRSNQSKKSRNDLSNYKKIDRHRKSVRQVQSKKPSMPIMQEVPKRSSITHLDEADRLMAKFGYECVVQQCYTGLFMFELFLPVELKNQSQMDQDFESDQLNLGGELDDSLDTNQSLKDFKDDKFQDFDINIQRQNLKKFFQQQKIKKTSINQQPGAITSQPTLFASRSGDYNTLGINSKQKSRKITQSLLVPNYQTIGNYYKNLTKKRKEENKDEFVDVLEDLNAAEVISLEELEEENDQDNFYLQMQNNVHVLQLLKDVGVEDAKKTKGKKTSLAKEGKYNSLKPFRLNLKEMEGGGGFDPLKDGGEFEKHSELDSLFNNSEIWNENSSQQSGSNSPKSERVNRGERLQLGPFKNQERTIKKIQEFKRRSSAAQLNLLKPLGGNQDYRVNIIDNLTKTQQQLTFKASKFHQSQEFLKKNNYLKDQTKIEGRLIKAVLSRNSLALREYLPQYELSLDTFQDQQGNTLLCVAAQLGAYDIVKQLLMIGCDPNINNKDGNVPLHFSIKYGFQNVTDLLISFGAKENLTNRFNKTPWEDFNM